MVEKQSWWDRIPEPIASVKGNALWSAICVAGGSVVNAYFTSKIFNKSLLIAAYIALASVSGAFAIWGLVSFLKARANKAAVEGMCAMLIVDCVYLLKTYRRLDYDNRDRVRYPLSRSSWPTFGQPWDHVAAELYSAQDNFAILRLKVGNLAA